MPEVSTVQGPLSSGGSCRRQRHRNEIYKKFDIMLKEVDEEYGTTLINFAKYKLVMFAMAKLMEMETTEQNKVELYLFNLI